MTLSDAIVFNLLLGLRQWEILMFLKSEEGINISVNIAQTSEVIGTVQERSPVGAATSGSLPAGAVEPVRDASRIQIDASEMHPSCASGPDNAP